MNDHPAFCNTGTWIDCVLPCVGGAGLLQLRATCGLLRAYVDEFCARQAQQERTRSSAQVLRMLEAYDARVPGFDSARVFQAYPAMLLWKRPFLAEVAARVWPYYEAREAQMLEAGLAHAVLRAPERGITLQRASALLWGREEFAAMRARPCADASVFCMALRDLLAREPALSGTTHVGSVATYARGAGLCVCVDPYNNKARVSAPGKARAVLWTHVLRPLDHADMQPLIRGVQAAAAGDGRLEVVHKRTGVLVLDDRDAFAQLVEADEPGDTTFCDTDPRHFAAGLPADVFFAAAQRRFAQARGASHDRAWAYAPGGDDGAAQPLAVFYARRVADYMHRFYHVRVHARDLLAPRGGVRNALVTDVLGGAGRYQTLFVGAGGACVGTDAARTCFWEEPAPGAPPRVLRAAAAAADDDAARPLFALMCEMAGEEECAFAPQPTARECMLSFRDTSLTQKMRELTDRFAR